MGLITPRLSPFQTRAIRRKTKAFALVTNKSRANYSAKYSSGAPVPKASHAQKKLSSSCASPG